MTTEMAESITGRPFFCSWSGGKDSCLALYHAIRSGGRPEALFTVLTEDGVRSRSHGLPRSFIEEQGRSLGMQAVFCSATWQQYEDEFISVLHEFKASGIEAGVFGDIDVASHREWVRRVCHQAGILPVHPLWGRDRQELLQEFIDLGFLARIVVINEEHLDKRFLGKSIRAQTIAEMEKAGIDPSGELGEYHTVVTDGPLFAPEVGLKTGGRESHEGCCFLRVDP